MSGKFAILMVLSLTAATARAQEASPEPSATPNPSPAEAPSAELIIDPEETVSKEPAVVPGEEPLPALDGKLPGEDNIFGDDLFGPAELYSPSAPSMPDAPPVIEDPNEAERKMRVKFRKMKTGIESQQDLIALKDMAKQARTPEDYRAARRAYYALFFDKVRKADPSMKDYADKLEKQSLADLYQTRIEPTVALNPPPEPQPRPEFIPEKQYPDLLPADEAPVALP